VVEVFVLAPHSVRLQVLAMTAEAYRIAEIGALLGDPARVSILTELMAGRALTAGELATVARVTPQTVSAHLRKLAQARLIKSQRQGRHHYVAIASVDVAQMLEAVYCVAAPPQPMAASGMRPRVRGPIRRARTCYDHLAGELGVALCDALVGRGYVALEAEAAQLTERGSDFAREFGLPLEAAKGSRRPLCRTCLDWSERRTHLAGRFGAALAERLFEKAWIERIDGGRALQITEAGADGLRATFAIAFG
jgi:DNA-binding transcriptional ArsR family regulator